MSDRVRNAGVVFPAGHYLTRQGEVGQHAWLIEDGRLEVILDGVDGPRKLGVIGKGAVVGEMALIDGAPRSAGVRALTQVRCIELSRSAFKQMIECCEPLAYYLLCTLIAAIRRSYGSKELHDADSDFSIRSVKNPHKILDRRSFEAGYVFFRQGDPGASAYLIQSGSVVIRRTGDDGETGVLAHLGPGRMFGELALLGDRPRGADAVAEQPTTCEIISRDNFDRAVASMPPILKAIMRIYVQQLSR